MRTCRHIIKIVQGGGGWWVRERKKELVSREGKMI